MKFLLKPFAVAVVAFATLSATYVSSEARIRCDGPYQIINGSAHASPFCNDAYLARVARTYGVRVSARLIRQDYEKKSEICRLIGHDNRVSDICTGFRNEYDGNDDSDTQN